uniref:P53 induced protein n=1 Tax=Rhizophora mucronata TaxID=61149 RepID=A0A2P2LHG8_RHIMU
MVRYKWNLSEVALDRRLVFFETNWAYFFPVSLMSLFFVVDLSCDLYLTYYSILISLTRIRHCKIIFVHNGQSILCK